MNTEWKVAFLEEANRTLHLSLPETTSSLLKSLCTILPVEAGLFYSVDPTENFLILKERYNIKMPEISSLEKQNTTDIATRAIKEKRVLEEDLRVTKSGLIRSLSERKRYFTKVVAVPIPRGTVVIDEAHKNVCDVFDLPYLGVLCVFLGASEQANSLVQFFSTITESYARYYVAAVQREKQRLRKAVVDRTLRVKDLNSFMNKALRVIDDSLHIEGASIFLWDKAQKILRLHATTGIKDSPLMEDVFYTEDEDRITVQVACTGKASITTNIVRDHPDSGKYEEIVKHGRQSFAAFPILNWGIMESPINARPLGVVRLINKCSRNTNWETVVSFTWEDLVLLSFFAELVGIVSNYMRRAEQERETFEQVIHGLKSSIDAVAGNIDLCVNHPEFITITDKRFKYRLPDTLAHINDIRWQVRRTLAWYRIHSGQNGCLGDNLNGPVKLTGEVLTKLQVLAEQMAVPLNTGIPRIVFSPNYESFINIPQVYGNTNDIQNVFRNIIENALKYSAPQEPVCVISLSFRLDKEYVYILVADDGIGIPRGLEDWIFVDGYRCDNAKRRRPGGGSGIGLPYSKDRMQAMKGDLQFERTNSSTVFVVKFQRI